MELLEAMSKTVSPVASGVFSSCAHSPGVVRAATPLVVRRLQSACRHNFSTAAARQPAVSIKSINPSVVAAKYAVRGPLLTRATEIERELRDATLRDKYPFDSIVKCNIGNPQALGQRAPHFARRVLALALAPELAEEEEAAEKIAAAEQGTAKHKSLFSDEAKQRAALYRAAGKVGAYSESKGLRVVREEVAAFIERRDGYASDPEAIHLTDGASAAVHRILSLLLTGDTRDALLVPYPQYPLYSALTTLDRGALAPYYLDEGKGWSIDADELDAAFDRAASDGKMPKAVVVINPGNPTGASLDRDTLEAVVLFCQRRRLALLADEVYQDNVYAGPPFVSLKKVVRDLQANDVPLFSFHSVSKGFTGECGLRGGYVEACNLDVDVRAQLDKLASISLCSNVVGQLAVGLMVHPPESAVEHERYQKDRDEVLASLQRRSRLVAAVLDALPGVSCPPAMGALYVFPRIDLPRRAHDAADDAGLAPDAFYAMRLLERTGLVVVPGSGFGQRDGTSHIRVAFLPPEADIDAVMGRLVTFHGEFMTEFGDDKDDEHAHGRTVSVHA